MSRFCSHLAGRPIGLSELSRRLGISRQATHKLSKEIAKLGFIEFIASETDARVILVRFTQKGWAMAESATRQLNAIEAEISEKIGEDNLAILKTILTKPWSENEK
jgi:DNA-binding MarR family transcriptional regulator